jgi:hypothetical protein
MTRLLPFATLALLLVATPVAAQEQRAADEPKQPTVSADGTEVFQYLLDTAKLKPITVKEAGQMGLTDDVVVIVLGRTDRAQNLPRFPLQFAAEVIQRGGAALIATDYPARFDGFPNGQDFNFGDNRIPNGFVAGADGAKPESLFLGRKNMPFAVPLDPLPNPAPEWRLFQGLDRIATNRPAFILAPNPRGEFAALLASYPDDCEYSSPEVGIGRVDHEKHFFAVGGSGWRRPRQEQYRFLALADPSVFINQMMLASDAQGNVDNLEFGARTVAYLVEKADGSRRTRCLLIQDGVVIEDFSALRRMIQPPLPMPNILAMQDKLTDFGNKIIDNIETNDFANKVMLGTRDEQRDERFKYIMQFVLAMLLIRAIWYLIKRTWMARRPADGPPPPSGGLPAPKKNEKVRGLFDRRQKELFRRNNLYEPVRMVVREMFLDAGGPEKPGKRLPEVEISNVIARPDTLVDALTDLWKIAYGPPRVVTVQRWKLLEPLFERVRLAHAEGKWRFV